MKAICVTGVIPSQLNVVNGILRNAGMKPAAPSKQDISMDIGYWHAKVLENAGQALNEQSEAYQIEPSGLWTQLASNIFFSNHNVACWGWCDSRSIFLLEFLLHFETQLKFILVVTSPEQFMSAALSGELEESTVDVLADYWRVAHEQMLRFFTRNASRCLLVDAEDCARSPEKLVETCNQHFGTSLDASNCVERRSPKEVPMLARFVARCMIPHIMDDCRSLVDALYATVSRFDGVDVQSEPITVPANMVSIFRSEVDRTKLEAELICANSRCSQLELALVANQDDAAVNEQRIREELRIEHEQAQEKFAELLRQSETERGELQDLLRGAQAEIKTLFSQVELERKGAEEARRELSLSRRELGVQQAALDELKSELNKQLAKVLTLTQERTESSAAASLAQDHVKKLEMEARLQEKHIKSLQRDLDARNAAIERSKGAEKDSRTQLLNLQRDCVERGKLLDQAALRIEMLMEEKVALEQLKVEWEVERAALSAKNAALHTESEQLRRELISVNEYALLNDEMESARAELAEVLAETRLQQQQLHQLQDELEYYFSRCQKLQQEATGVTNYLHSIAQRNVDFVSMESLVIETTGDNGSAIFRFKNLILAGRYLEELALRSSIEGKIARLEVLRGKEGASPLMRWPRSAPDRGVLHLIPFGGDSAMAKSRVSALMELAPQDWNVVSSLVGVFTRLVAGTLGQEPLSAPVADLANNIVSSLTVVVNSLPDNLRYGAVSLKREQVNTDYEHLWISIDTMSFGSLHWRDVEFRLSCAHVTGKNFGSFPKLEFPEGRGAIPFESWYVESADDFGRKLELRFALPDSLDVAVWSSISIRDRAFVVALIDKLPDMLASLQQGGLVLHRPWSAWSRLVDSIQDVLRRHAQDNANPTVVSAKDERKVDIKVSGSNDVAPMRSRSKALPRLEQNVTQSKRKK